MKRRNFSKLLTVFAIGTAVSPRSSFAWTSSLPYEELIGKGSPQLYGDGYLMRKEAFDAFIEMEQAAIKEGLSIHVVSSYRNYDHQKRIWERKYKNNVASGMSPMDSMKKIIEYSTIPGTSRHHWGTDIDIVDGRFLDTPNILSASHFEKDQPFYELGQWLNENAETYGFHLVYTNMPERKGFKYEPWHFSYKPLSFDYLKSYRELDILKILQLEDFEGASHFTEAFMSRYIEENILDINPNLLV